MMMTIEEGEEGDERGRRRRRRRRRGEGRWTRRRGVVCVVHIHIKYHSRGDREKGCEGVVKRAEERVGYSYRIRGDYLGASIGAKQVQST
jgi:hypothetical protein